MTLPIKDTLGSVIYETVKEEIDRKKYSSKVRSLKDFSEKEILELEKRYGCSINRVNKQNKSKKIEE